MRRVGESEFLERVEYYLLGEEAIAVERNGEIVGYYMPVPQEHVEKVPLPRRDIEEARLAQERLNRAVEQVLAESGMTEEELSAYFDLNRPVDDAPGNATPGR